MEANSLTEDSSLSVSLWHCFSTDHYAAVQQTLHPGSVTINKESSLVSDWTVLSHCADWSWVNGGARTRGRWQSAGFLRPSSCRHLPLLPLPTPPLPLLTSHPRWRAACTTPRTETSNLSAAGEHLRTWTSQWHHSFIPSLCLCMCLFSQNRKRLELPAAKNTPLTII